MVPAKSHSLWQSPGTVGRTVVVVVVEVVVVVGVVVDDDADARFNSSDMSIAWAPCCSSNFSIENGVVETVGQPVNSVVALLWDKYEEILLVKDLENSNRLQHLPCWQSLANGD